MVRLISSLLCTASLLAARAEGFTPSTRAISTQIRSAQNQLEEKNAIQTTLVHSTRGGTRILAWPLARDPKGMASDYPLAAARIAITIASTYFTWYAQGQYSNVMASSAFTLICSMLFDKRLGQVSLCYAYVKNVAHVGITEINFSDVLFSRLLSVVLSPECVVRKLYLLLSLPCVLELSLLCYLKS